jgi:hypothetical protein
MAIARYSLLVVGVRMKKENKFDDSFFCVCGKCKNKIYKHLGIVEFPEGKFTLNVRCELCNFEFQHTIWSPEAMRRAKAEKAANMLNKNALTDMATAVFKKMGDKK